MTRRPDGRERDEGMREGEKGMNATKNHGDADALPTTHRELFERTLDRRGRPAGRDPLPRTIEDIHARATSRGTRER